MAMVKDGAEIIVGSVEGISEALSHHQRFLRYQLQGSNKQSRRFTRRTT